MRPGWDASTCCPCRRCPAARVRVLRPGLAPIEVLVDFRDVQVEPLDVRQQGEQQQRRFVASAGVHRLLQAGAVHAQGPLLLRRPLCHGSAVPPQGSHRIAERLSRMFLCLEMAEDLQGLRLLFSEWGLRQAKGRHVHNVERLETVPMVGACNCKELMLSQKRVLPFRAARGDDGAGHLPGAAQAVAIVAAELLLDLSLHLLLRGATAVCPLVPDETPVDLALLLPEIALALAVTLAARAARVAVEVASAVSPKVRVVQAHAQLALELPLLQCSQPRVLLADLREAAPLLALLGAGPVAHHVGDPQDLLMAVAAVQHLHRARA
mmetsp:Transcript_141617/g.394809  ORF Transcript_141617/g.394809 Transcript_141617/m.394809 type:complete len:323 (+) Transcript_141617:1334-2302(+)